MARAVPRDNQGNAFPPGLSRYKGWAFDPSLAARLDEAAWPYVAGGAIGLAHPRRRSDPGWWRGAWLRARQLPVAQHGVAWVEVGVGVQHKDATEPLVRLDLIGIDRELIAADRLRCRRNPRTSALSYLASRRSSTARFAADRQRPSRPAA
jgi:hypothetical protein